MVNLYIFKMSDQSNTSKKQFSKNDTSSKFIAILLTILLIYKAFKFTNLDRNEHPLLSTLFDMILILTILLFLLHKSELIRSSEKLAILNRHILINIFGNINKINLENFIQ